MKLRYLAIPFLFVAAIFISCYAQNSYQPVDPNKLEQFLPAALDGWAINYYMDSKGEPGVGRQYEKENKLVILGIYNIILDSDLNFLSKHGPDFKNVNVKGFPAITDGKSSLEVYVKNKIRVHVGAPNIDTVYLFSDKIDYQGIAALVK